MNTRRTRRHVLLVIRWPVGGIRTFLRYYYRRFEAEDYQVTVLAPKGPETDVLLRDLSMFSPEYIGFRETIGGPEFFALVANTLRRERYDLVHSQGFTAGICCSLPACMTRTPHVFTVHDVINENQFRGSWRGGVKLLLTAAFLSSDMIHFVSRDSRDSLTRFAPTLELARGKTIVLPHGIDTAPFLTAVPRDLRKELSVGGDRFLIGFFGRFMSQKGFTYLIDAVDMLRADPSLPGKVLVAAFGVGGFLSDEKRDIAKRNLGEYFSFFPFEENIAPVMKGLDVMVMPSLWEAFGLLAAEALVAGVPVIGTSCIGLREVLYDTPARVVPPADSRALALAIKAEMLHSSKAAARAYQPQAAARFDVGKRAVELEALLRQVMARRYRTVPDPIGD